mmetsp:Transcript_22617/g.36996  ORF Transcript_22617/g.36996 Transcript_22617/m.36996 type:complete len:220 (+) Transcript_22617:296-955(+)
MVNRQFHAPAPNVLWVNDCTYVATWQGFVYVTFVIDVFARRIVGWRVRRTATAGFVMDALEQAIHERRPAQNQLAHHSDRGSQYLSLKYTKRLAEAKIARQSEALRIPMTMLWPRRSTACSKQKSFTDAGHGAASKQLNTPPSNGSNSSTIAVCWRQSGISRQQRPKQTSTQLWKIINGRVANTNQPPANPARFTRGLAYLCHWLTFAPRRNRFHHHAL